MAEPTGRRGRFSAGGFGAAGSLPPGCSGKPRLMVALAITSGFLTSIASCALAIRCLRRLQILDVPNARSSHGRPTVRGAGIGVACGTVVGALASIALAGGPGWPWRATFAIVIATLCAAAIGLADDLRSGISFRVRLLGQATVAVGAVASLGVGATPVPWGALLAVGGVVGVVGYVNAFNFMDGINGISGVTGFVAGALFAVVGHLEELPLLAAGGAALASACIGFLPFNAPHARAFLGDVGSYFIGAWIALLAYLAAAAGVPLDVVLAPLALYLADVGTTLATRVWRGEQWHAAHRDHAYQRLVGAGLSHMETAFLVLIVSLGLAGLGLVSLRMSAGWAVAWPAMAVLLAGYLAAPSLVERQRSRKASITSRDRASGPPHDGPSLGRGSP